MNCYYHDDRAAVGSCRSCLKGVCRECAVDLERGLACRDRCETDVRELMDTIHQSVQTRSMSTGLLKASRGLWSGLGIIALIVGLAVAYIGLSLPGFESVGLLALPFLLIGLLTLRAARTARAG